MKPPIHNTLRGHRTARGWTQAELAERARITRQSYVAIEGGRSVPSTEVALRLARALGQPVEELFVLAPGEAEALQVPLAPGTLHPGRVRLARVGEETLAFSLEAGGAHTGVLADGVAEFSGEDPGLTVRSLGHGRQAAELVLIGCDPALGLLAAFLKREHDVEVLWLPAGSRRALEALAVGGAHVAGVHLPDPDGGGYNGPWVERLIPFPASRIRFTTWEQCLVLAPGNPLGIQGVEDLARPGLRFLNREPGSGSRLLLQLQCESAGVPAETLPGFQETAAPSHDAVGSAVAAGAADAGVAIRAVALNRGLAALTLVWEPFDLVIPQRFQELSAVQLLLATLRRPAFQRQVEALGGYDVARMGESA